MQKEHHGNIFTNEDHFTTVHKKRQDMVLNLGLGQKGVSFADQTPTPTQFIRNCEEVGLFQDLQNVNPFEETFKKAVEAIKSGQLSLEKSYQSPPPDDTLHTPNVFPHITDGPNINISDACNEPETIPPCENELLKEDICDNAAKDITRDQNITQPVLNLSKTESVMPSINVDNSLQEKVILNIPDGHLVQLLTPDDSKSSCNMVVIKNTMTDTFTVKEKLKKSLSEKKIGKTMQHKLPITKCSVRKTSNSFSNKFSKFSKNAKKLISKLENSGATEINEHSSNKQKKISKVPSKESRSEFLARSRAASSRCREKKKMYVLYLEKISSELATANQNLVLINSLLRQELRNLHNELLKHRNCNAADQNTEAALTAAANISSEEIIPKKLPVITVEEPTPQETSNISTVSTENIPSVEFVPTELTPTDQNLFSFDVAEVILNGEPDESEIPLTEENKPPDIIVRFNSAGNNFPAAFPLDTNFDQFIEKAGETFKQIYEEHCYYFKKSAGDVDKRIMNYKTFREAVEPPITSDECKKLNVLQMQLQQSEAFSDLTSLNSKVLIGPRTPPPLILLKPFKKRSLQNKRPEKT